MKKTTTGYLVSGAFFAVGVILRFNARALAWPKQFSFSGERANTKWAQMEMAYSDVALALMIIGGLLLAVTLARWLFEDTPRKTP
jgi:hypothetical protein